MSRCWYAEIESKNQNSSRNYLHDHSSELEEKNRGSYTSSKKQIFLMNEKLVRKKKSQWESLSLKKCDILSKCK